MNEFYCDLFERHIAQWVVSSAEIFKIPQFASQAHKILLRQKALRRCPVGHENLAGSSKIAKGFARNAIKLLWRFNCKARVQVMLRQIGSTAANGSIEIGKKGFHRAARDCLSDLLRNMAGSASRENDQDGSFGPGRGGVRSSFRDSRVPASPQAI